MSEILDTEITISSFESSPSIIAIAKALISAQKNIGSAKKGASNPFFKSKYADLGAVLEACKEPLNNEGIAILQPISSSNGTNFVKTLLLHESGEYISSTMQLILSKNDMQQAGSAISYARRYTLQSLISLPAEDDDGEKTMSRKTTTFSKPKATKKAEDKPEPIEGNSFRKRTKSSHAI